MPEILPYGQCYLCKRIVDELKAEKEYPEGCRIVLCKECRKIYRKWINPHAD
jgi:hypothetical protein